MRTFAVLAASATAVVMSAAPASASAAVAVDDAYYVLAGTTLTVPAPGLLANDKELVTGLGVKALSTLPTGLTLYTAGNVTYDAPDAPGTFTFNYCIIFPENPGSCLSNVGVVTVRVVDAPVPANDTYATPFSTYLEVPGPGVLSNDSGVPPGATVAWLDALGGFAGNPDGGFAYHPGLSTTPATIRYCVLNQATPPGCMSDLAVLTINVGPGPEAVDDDYAIPVNAQLALPAPGVMSNDKNVPSGSTVSWQTQLPAGVTLHEDGALDYTPAPDFVGEISFDYCIRDKNIPPGCLSTATVTLRVTPLPSPSAVDDAYTITAGQTLNVPAPGVLSNDLEVPAYGVAALVDPDGTVTLAADGSFSYVPGDGFTGTHQFIYCVALVEGGPCSSEPATVTITVVAAPGGGGGNLPVTGANVTWFTLAGLTLILAGAGVFLLMRRRRASL